MTGDRTRPDRAALPAPLALLVVLPLLAPPAAASPEAPPPAGADAARQLLVTIAEPPAPMLGGAGSTPRGYRAPRDYRSSPRAKRTAARLARDYGLRHLDAWPIELLDVHCVVFEVPEGLSTEELLERLADDERVDSAQPMQLFATLADRRTDRDAPMAGAGGYDDPYLHLQHGLRSMHVEEAHRFARGDGVEVAVIDTGVDVGHPELDGRIAAAENFVDDDPVAFTADAHGTAVAGVIASIPGNGIGIAGVAPAVRVLALKACWTAGGGGDEAVCSTFTLAKAISHAADRGADLLNLSLTGPDDPLLAALLGKVVERGTVVVAAARPGTEPPGFPASLDGVIAVRSAAAAGTARAAEARLPAAVLEAPGIDVLTIRPRGAYDFVSGSSLAAAHVSGLAALLLEHRPRLSAAEIVDILESTSRLRSADGGGGINACAALARILGSINCTAESRVAATGTGSPGSAQPLAQLGDPGAADR